MVLAVAFEIEHFVGVDAAVAQLADDLHRHRAEILADHHATVALAFQRQHRQQIVHRVFDIGAATGGFAIRDPPQPQQRHDVIDAQRAAAGHVGAQKIDERLIPARRHHVRIHRRQAPVLPQRPQNIRRRPDRRFQAVQLTVTPGFRPAFRHPDRQIAIQANRHLLLPALVKTLRELGGRQPLQPQVKADRVLMFGAKLPHRVALPLPIALGPGRPAPLAGVFGRQMGMQRIKRRLLIQAVAPSATNCSNA